MGVSQQEEGVRVGGIEVERQLGGARRRSLVKGV